MAQYGAIFRGHNMKVEQAFTFIELLITIIIICILIVISLPIYSRAVERSRIAESYTQLALIKVAEFDHYASKSYYVGRVGIT